MSNVVPTLSTFSWVESVPEKTDFLLAHFALSDNLQSSLYVDQISSLPSILQRNAGSMDSTTSDMQNVLQRYLGKFFDLVRVEVNYKEENADKSNSRMLITLGITIVDKNVEYPITRLLSVVDGRFKEFVNINNGE